MAHEKQLAKMADLMMWMATQAEGLSLPNDRRASLAIRCFHAVNEYQGAIAILFNQKMFGSAFALLRVLVEAHIKGMWVLRCASDEELQKFVEHKLNKTFQAFIDDIEKASPELENSLSLFKKTFWGTLNGFTHTGLEQLSRRQVFAGSESTYSDEDLTKLLAMASAWGAMSYGEIFNLAKRRDLQMALVEQMAS